MLPSSYYKIKNYWNHANILCKNPDAVAELKKIYMKNGSHINPTDFFEPEENINTSYKFKETCMILLFLLSQIQYALRIQKQHKDNSVISSLYLEVTNYYELAKEFYNIE